MVVYDSVYPYEKMYTIATDDELSDYKFVNEDDKFYHTHDPYYLPNGNLLV